MGNCMERPQKTEENMQKQQWQSDEERERSSCGFVNESNNIAKNGTMRVKIVLTKEELEWLMLQLKDRGGKGLDELLAEIKKSGRGKVIDGWKPSLESVMEIPEVDCDMDR
ncbi:Deoxyhypusine synthase [Quillaja saponaria]|uniref:Deoxyhypusine synthase n=1 Tax=Quillaja saponaria TaxID=32244 RepID=A0AAD7L5U5_QUISA|nr:Deoxyhypusine synthase [Quillaja saponaria]